MTRLLRSAVLAGLLGCLAPVAFAAPEYAGIWTGPIKTPADLPIVFRVTRNPDGSLQAAFDSPDQGATGLQVDTFAIKDGVLRIEMRGIGAGFEGKLSADGQRAEGQWKQGGASFPLTLERVEELPERNRPQVPKKPYSYAEEEVSYEKHGRRRYVRGHAHVPQFRRPVPGRRTDHGLRGSGPRRVHPGAQAVSGTRRLPDPPGNRGAARG